MPAPGQQKNQPDERDQQVLDVLGDEPEDRVGYGRASEAVDRLVERVVDAGGEERDNTK
jgi:hypothetical protein